MTLNGFNYDGKFEYRDSFLKTSMDAIRGYYDGYDGFYERLGNIAYNIAKREAGDFFDEYEINTYDEALELINNRGFGWRDNEIDSAMENINSELRILDFSFNQKLTRITQEQFIDGLNKILSGSNARFFKSAYEAKERLRDIQDAFNEIEQIILNKDINIKQRLNFLFGNYSSRVNKGSDGVELYKQHYSSFIDFGQRILLTQELLDKFEKFFQPNTNEFRPSYLVDRIIDLKLIQEVLVSEKDLKDKQRVLDREWFEDALTEYRKIVAEEAKEISNNLQDTKLSVSEDFKNRR